MVGKMALETFSSLPLLQLPLAYVTQPKVLLHSEGFLQAFM
jgi:hypothetical protein